MKKFKISTGRFILFISAIIGLVTLVVSFLINPDRKGKILIEQQPKIAEEKEESKDVYQPPANASKITGLACDNFDKRPFAVMYSGDFGARKYFANLSLADFVLEMPHRYTHGQPRLMGIFQCNTPEIVGPMRSGRVDHISVANSFNAIYVPWGGSSIGKALLKKSVVDHIDCNGEVYPSGGAACFRREGPMSRLASASSSIPELIKKSEEVGYEKSWNWEGFQHQGDVPEDERPKSSVVKIGFESPTDVEYHYKPETNSYSRFFHGAPDVDYETKNQYAPKNLIVIQTEKEPWLVGNDYLSLGVQDPWTGVDALHRRNDNGHYPNMQLGDPWFDTKHSGPATFYLNGEEIIGTWRRKKESESPFEFFDGNGEHIQFVPGQIWMHVLETYRIVSCEENNQPSEPEQEL